MSLRKRVAKTTARGTGGGTPLLDEIEAGIEEAVRNLMRKGDLSVPDLLKIREVVREILAERPREIEVRWVNSCEGTGKRIAKKDDGPGEPSET